MAMGRLGEDKERKLRAMLGKARAATHSVGSHREEDGGDFGEKEAAELVAWDDVYRHLTDDDLGGGRHKDIIPDRPKGDAPKPEGGQ